MPHTNKLKIISGKSNKLKISVVSWLSGWNYRKKVTLTGQTGAGTNYQVKLLIGATSSASGEDFDLEGHSLDFPSAKNDGGDLRFTTNNGETLLDFWVESVTGSGDSALASIWVEVADSLESNVDIYIYYGNDTSGLANYSNGENTFNFFDDFEGTSLDEKWTELGSVTVSNSEVNFTDDDAITGDTLFGFGYEVRSRAKANEQDVTFVGFRNDPYDGNLQAVINSDHPNPNDFNKFKCGLFKGGGADPNFYIDGWYDFRNTYYQYFTKRLASDKIIWGQADNSDIYTNSTYIPINDLAPYLGVWDNTQESTLTVDWIFVRKVIETEPSYNISDSEESTLVRTNKLKILS